MLSHRLAKNISSQIKERLNKSHDSFASALKQLEQKHSGRLDRIEEGRLKLRKVHAPRVAKVALESTSLMDVILNGKFYIWLWQGILKHNFTKFSSILSVHFTLNRNWGAIFICLKRSNGLVSIFLKEISSGKKPFNVTLIWFFEGIKWIPV